MAKSVKTVDLSNTTGLYYGPATISSGKTLHIAGQPGSTKDGHVPDDYESQIHLSLLNLRKLIIAAGASVSDIAKLNVYIVNYDVSNRKHARHIQRFLGSHRPAMTLVPVPALAVPSWLIEIDAIVALPEQPSAGPALPAASESYDVVIIGAGLAGLTAAHEVRRAGLSCVVLEARDRVGGKTWSQPNADGKGVIDLGAAWINDTSQSKVYELAKRYGAEMIEQNTTGNIVLEDFDGKVSPFAYGELPNFDEATKKNVVEIRDLCEAECQALDTWRPKDTAIDSLTFEAFLRSRGAGEAALATATIWTRAMLGVEPRDISALYFLNYCKSGGGLLQMRSDRKGGGQYLRIRQGTQVFSKGLASDLPEGIVRLDSPVKAVVQESDRTVKVQAAGTVYSARKIITTVPGPVLKNITFYPKLPPAKQLWSESLTYGYYTKAMLEFKTPFWVERGYCGLTQSFIGPANVVRDSCSPADEKWVLTCFMCGDAGRAWAELPMSDREKAIIKQLETLWKVRDLESQFVQMTSYEWVNDEWTGWGCPCPSLPPGVLDTLGGDGLREPCGNLYFAGTETAGEWKGYMEGAVRSGERAAGEVVKDLNAGAVKPKLFCARAMISKRAAHALFGGAWRPSVKFPGIKQVRSLYLLEHQSQVILKETGIAIPDGIITETVKDTKNALEQFGGKAVLKPQVLLGSRQSRILKDSQDGETLAAKLIESQTGPSLWDETAPSVRRLYVEESIQFDRKWHVSMAVDRENYCPVVRIQEIKTTSENSSTEEKHIRKHCFNFSLTEGIPQNAVIDISEKLNLSKEVSQGFGRVLQGLFKIFSEKEAISIEVDMLNTVDEQLICADSVFLFDDAAQKRQPDLFALRQSDQEVQEEVEAERHGLVYVRMGGNIGNVVNGAGLAMATNDAISLHGGTSANFLDAGGQATKQTMLQAFGIIMRDERVKAILVNIYGGITKCDMIAESIIAAASELGPLRVPMVVRLQGTNSEAGLKLLENSDLGIHVEADFGEAARRAVELAKGRL
ncbi:hypothetical protein FZEAL_2202 [Fusarium zealandicum]|uniref:Amine oxidase n=1 Tax=Fusarium zealandicum TaxID=1053134 RepID=A0A8H4XNN4_9HYPO|nr:hypothetical protein FZEAL_2202 [Fusarium zealandicum]